MTLAAAVCVAAGLGFACVALPRLRVTTDADVRQTPPSASLDLPATDDWPNLFGPHRNSRVAADASSIAPWGPEGPRVLWRIPCGAGYSSPIVSRGRLILLHRVGDEEIVACHTAASGEQLWEQRYPTSFVCGSHYTHGPYSTPAADGERVYTLGAQGQLHCLSLDDGRLLWSHTTNQEFDVQPDVFGAGHSPLVWGERLILNVGGRAPDGGVVAFDKRTGEVLWRSTGHGPSFATPQPARFHGRDWLLVFTADGLSLIDPEIGREQWCIDFASRVVDMYNAVTPLVHGDLVMISVWGVGSRVIRILSDGGWTEVWDSRRILTSQYTPLLAEKGCVIGVHALDDSLRCVELESGRLRWRWKSELANCKPVVVGRQVLLLGEYGHLGLLPLDVQRMPEGTITSQSLFAGPDRCFSAPAYADGRLYVRNEAEVLCIDPYQSAVAGGD